MVTLNTIDITNQERIISTRRKSAILKTLFFLLLIDKLFLGIQLLFLRRVVSAMFNHPPLPNEFNIVIVLGVRASQVFRFLEPESSEIFKDKIIIFVFIRATRREKINKTILLISIDCRQYRAVYN